VTGRERLAEQQAELLTALLAGGEPPAGFDAERVRDETIVLRNKRRRVTAYLRPDLRQALGDRFGEQFDAYAGGHPRTVDTRARDDADAFGDWLVEQGQLQAPKKRWQVGAATHCRWQLPRWRVTAR
jgi:hypothetical protein